MCEQKERQSDGRVLNKRFEVLGVPSDVLPAEPFVPLHDVVPRQTHTRKPAGDNIGQHHKQTSEILLVRIGRSKRNAESVAVQGTIRLDLYAGGSRLSVSGGRKQKAGPTKGWMGRRGRLRHTPRAWAS